MRHSVDWVWLFLKPRGRLTRLPYFLATLLVSMLASFVVYRHVLGYYPDNALDPWATPGLNDLLTLVYVVTLWPMLALSAKRLQDMGRSPYIAVLIGLPMVSMLAYFVFALFPGADGPNAYGGQRNAPPTS